MATIKDVAKYAGLSASVVSKYLKDSTSVRSTTRERIEAAIEQLDYRPTLIARAMRTGRTNMILIVVPTLEDRKVNILVNNLQRIAGSHGFTIVLLTEETLKNLYEDNDSKTAISTYPVDGVLFCYPADSEIIQRFATEFRNIPRVVIGWPIWDDVSTFLWDVGYSAYIVTQHLLTLNHERIAYIGTVPRNYFFRTRFNRETAFRQAFRDADAPLYENLVCIHEGRGKSVSDYSAGLESAQVLLSRPKPPTAIVCESVDIAIACRNYALSQGIAIPGDVAIACCEDSFECIQSYPPLTAALSPVNETAELALNKLLAIIDGTDDHQILRIMPTEFPTILNVRHSTDPNKPDI